MMRVLIVGSMNGQVTTAAQIAISRGAHVAQVDNIDQALEMLRSGRGADVLFVDLRCPIAQLIKNLALERINIPVIACGIEADPQAAATAIKAGAKEFMPLPPDPELIAAILQAITQADKCLIVQDPTMERWVHMAEKIAPSEASVLITGESGTGKEVIARHIHQRSRRSQKPFISVNCAAIPENLLESELFGHEKGAFTGAVARRIGKFEEASGGTLLLDEISEMHPRLQAKLLRAIQERVIDRVGGTQPVKVDIRIIATSNRDLLKSTKTGDFREDLYYRLNVVNIQLPPLRDRPKDILALSKYFIKKYTELNHLPLKLLTEKAIQAMENYPWPGNVRELENTIHRAVLLSSGEKIDVDDVFDGTTAQPAQGKIATTLDRQLLIGKTVAAAEKELILATLDHCYGNRTHAAHILGISIRTLRNKLKEYSHEDDETTKTATFGR